MARVIRMQAYKDWKDGLITTEEMLAGKVFREPPKIRKTWEGIMARINKDWDKVPHHTYCCCDKCAPTRKDAELKLELHKQELAKSAFEESQNVMANEGMPELDHDRLCCCNTCIDELFEKDYNNLAPSDCEPE